MRESPLNKSTENKYKPCPEFHLRPNIRSANFFHPFCLLMKLMDHKKAPSNFKT